VEVTVPKNGPDKVTVRGAGRTEADYIGFEPSGIEKHAAAFGEDLAREITDRTLDFTLGSIEKWAVQFPERWADQWSGYSTTGKAGAR